MATQSEYEYEYQSVMVGSMEATVLSVLLRINRLGAFLKGRFAYRGMIQRNCTIPNRLHMTVSEGNIRHRGQGRRRDRLPQHKGICTEYQHCSCYLSRIAESVYRFERRCLDTISGVDFSPPFAGNVPFHLCQRHRYVCSRRMSEIHAKPTAIIAKTWRATRA